MNILIANDHGAVDLKHRLVSELRARGHSVDNRGVDTADSVDYPDVAVAACKAYLGGGYDFGILCCGSGVGIAMAANKVKGIRCAQVFDLFTAEMCKRHNDANFISFGGRIDYGVDVMAMIEAYMAARFEGDRHQRRVDKLNALG